MRRIQTRRVVTASPKPARFSFKAFTPLKRGGIVFVAGLIPVIALSRAGTDHLARFGTSVTGTQFGQLIATVLSFGGGLVSGLIPVGLLYLLRRFPDVGLALFSLAILYLILVPGAGAGMAFLSGGAGFWIGLVGGWFWLFGLPKLPRLSTFGSAQWADAQAIDDAGCFAEHGYWLGEFAIPKRMFSREDVKPKTVRYAGDRHLITFAPTRGGKGVSSIIPNLLTHQGSLLCIDVKGENALVTAIARNKMGQHVHLVDPWDQVASRFQAKSACFNPMDSLIENDPDLAENAMMIAGAIVVPGKNAEQFWDDEAKAVLHGFILYVATDYAERMNRHLGRVRELLLLGKKDMKGVFERMCLSNHALVRSAGERGLQKDEKLLSNVLATTQSHTHFLDSPRIVKSLSKSDFDFTDLKTKRVSIYLILPPERLETFGRWLRLLIQQAIIVNARNIETKPDKPVLFMLDEMATLGKLDALEMGFGLMAGYGMQFWAILQDANQLERIYDKGWQSFIANAGVVQYFGSRDKATAEYFSALCGMATVHSLSTAISSGVSSAMNGQSSSSQTTTKTKAEAQRSLAYADELMRLPKDKQLLLIENADPISADRLTWYADPRLKPLGLDLHRPNE